MRNFTNFRSQLENEYAQVVKFTPKAETKTAERGKISQFDQMIKSGLRRPSLIK